MYVAVIVTLLVCADETASIATNAIENTNTEYDDFFSILTHLHTMIIY